MWYSLKRYKICVLWYIVYANFIMKIETHFHVYSKMHFGVLSNADYQSIGFTSKCRINVDAMT